MGLCIFNGPKWEDDSLNEINELSVLLNAKKMAEEYRIGYPDSHNKNKYLPNVLG